MMNDGYLPKVYGQFVYKNSFGTETVCPEFLISDYGDEPNVSEFPDVAYDIKNNAFLVVWSGEYSIDSTIVTVESVDKDEGFIEQSILPIETLYPFSEINGISARPVIAYDSVKSKFLGRDTKEFDPDENATRAEASAIIERMLRYLEFIN